MPGRCQFVFHEASWMGKKVEWNGDCVGLGWGWHSGCLRVGVKAIVIGFQQPADLT